MILTVLSSDSTSWLVEVAITAAIAMCGGIFVFIGLLKEKKFTKVWYSSIEDFRSSQLKAHKGWKLLMWGIAIEILVAGGIAVWDGWAFWQIKKHAPRNITLAHQRNFRSGISLIQDKPPVRIFFNEKVPDAESLGAQIESVFLNAGFTVNRVYGVNLTGRHGVLVGKFNDETNSAVGVIIGSLESSGLLSGRMAGLEIFPNEIIIDIEDK